MSGECDRCGEHAVDCQCFPGFYISREQVEKYWPKEPTPTPAWDRFASALKKYIDYLKSVGK